MKNQANYSYLSNAEGQYIEDLYRNYKENPQAVDPSWQKFFEGFEYAQLSGPSEGLEASQLLKEIQVLNLIEAYRSRGHLLSKTNPIRDRRDREAGLTLENYGLNESDLKTRFQMGKELGMENSTLEEILKRLKQLYTGPVGIEFKHIKDNKIRKWVEKTFESSFLTKDLPVEKKKRILEKLNESSVLENFLHTKYVGQKRFSLEGGENTIPAVDAIINEGAEFGVEEVIIGMAHRGRLNILANIMRKTYGSIFSEFEGKNVQVKRGDGDVKYHLGFSSVHETPAGKNVFLKLMPNPSHLETVAPVVGGYVRAKIDCYYKGESKKILPILIHGDAAIAGQGIAYEVAQMSKLPAYSCGGTIHFIINNQIGFTTDFDDARSADYCTSVAKVVDSPVIHVNGDDAEAVNFAVELATQFRQTFQQDFYIDMVCYRKWGHNEGDEPRFTQPVLYDRIKKHQNPREIYLNKLVEKDELSADLAKKMHQEFKQLLQDRLNKIKEQDAPQFKREEPDNEWRHFMLAKPEDFNHSPETAISQNSLEQIKKALAEVPQGLTAIKKIEKLIDERGKRFDEDRLDWALGELVAYGSLLQNGHDVRFTGQDVVRGTFTHRQAAYFDEKTNQRFDAFDSLEERQGRFRLYNSLLSEYGVLGFEYGYSLCSPQTLTLWEAQFGDFANGGQIVTDQFISSAESKWQKNSGLVMLLPHGYEGQGPEHSSAKPERFLQLCAEFNMVLIDPTTPANFFHALRRQMVWKFRKPLIVLTPKSLLRHPQCVSPKKDFLEGGFQEFIDDSYCEAKKVKRVLLCTGKIYYDLLEKQQADQRKDVAIVRMEQLHPIPFERLDNCLNQYKGSEFFWVQEEPKNMGFWNYILRKLDYYNLNLVSRKSSASTATGHGSIHKSEQDEIIKKAFE